MGIGTFVKEKKTNKRENALYHLWIFSMLLFFFLGCFFLFNESNKELFTKGKPMSYKINSLKEWFYFCTMSMRELLLHYFFILVIQWLWNFVVYNLILVSFHGVQRVLCTMTFQKTWKELKIKRTSNVQ
jgi:hypothetical protein